MDFLLECIGFPPGVDTDELIDLVRKDGEPVPWRGDPKHHLRLPLADGLEVRLDREAGQSFWTLLPHYQVPHRLRFAVEALHPIPDSPFDALLTGWACPPQPGDPDESDPGAFRMSTWLTDARRLPKNIEPNHVLAISVAGYALEVSYVGPSSATCDPAILERPHEAYIAPLGTPNSPGGCCEVSLRMMAIRHLRNPLSGRDVTLIVADSPGRPLLLFVSPWQLETDGLEQPRMGWRIEGTFLFSGRIAGGLPGPRRRLGRSFG